MLDKVLRVIRGGARRLLPGRRAGRGPFGGSREQIESGSGRCSPRGGATSCRRGRGCPGSPNGFTHFKRWKFPTPRGTGGAVLIFGLLPYWVDFCLPIATVLRAELRSRLRLVAVCPHGSAGIGTPAGTSPRPPVPLRPAPPEPAALQPAARAAAGRPRRSSSGSPAGSRTSTPVTPCVENSSISKKESGGRFAGCASNATGTPCAACPACSAGGTTTRCSSPTGAFTNWAPCTGWPRLTESPRSPSTSGNGRATWSSGKSVPRSSTTPRACGRPTSRTSCPPIASGTSSGFSRRKAPNWQEADYSWAGQPVAAEQADRLRAELGLSADKPVALLCTNVAHDAAVLGRTRGFASMAEWMLSTVGWFARHTDWQLVIRCHPGETVSPSKEAGAGAHRGAGSRTCRTRSRSSARPTGSTPTG